MENRELTCIGCPIGCNLTVTIGDNGDITVTGNTCPKGAEYAKNEVTNPRRTVTSTVQVNNGKTLSVKTKEDIPKDKIMDCVLALKNVVAKAPVHIGDVVLHNVAGTGIDVVATKEIGRDTQCRNM